MPGSLLIVYHSQSGASFRLAAAARRGALKEKGTGLTWRRAWDAGMSDLQHCGGLLLVAAENSGSLAGGMKDFLDRCFYPAQPLQLNLPYGLVISCGNDGRNTSQLVQRIMTGFPMKLVSEPLVFRGEPTAGMESQCEELGQALAAGIGMGIY
jgi:hypothetical protein